MTKEMLIRISERNLSKAKRALDYNYNRQGITEAERENLSIHVKYAEFVCELIKANVQ